MVYDEALFVFDCCSASLFRIFLITDQQAEVIKAHTDLKVGKYWGDMGVDFWDAATWNQELEKREVSCLSFFLLWWLSMLYF